MYLLNFFRHGQNEIQAQFLNKVCIYPTPSPQTEWNTRSIFKQSMYLPNFFRHLQSSTQGQFLIGI